MSTSQKCELEGRTYVKRKNEIFTMAQRGRRRSSPIKIKIQLKKLGMDELAKN